MGWDIECNFILPPHHVISKQRTRNNPEARRLIDKVYPHLFLVEACQACHEHAHNREVTARVLKHRAVVWGEDYIRGVLDEIADTSYKKSLEDIRWDRLID